MVDIEVYSKTKQKLRQPAAEWLPSTPFLMGVSGPSMSGKGVLVQNNIMNPELYHGEKGDPVFDEVHYWTGSAKLDVNLEKLKRWTEDVLKQDPDKNPAIHDGFKPAEVREVIERQRKAVRKARRESKRVPQMLFVVDDLADDKRTMGCGLIRELMLRGRHSMISTILSTQKMRAIDHACRLQFTALAQFAVRSIKDWEVIMEEFTAAIDPKVLQEMYNIATSDPIRLLVHGYEEQQVLQKLQVRAQGALLSQVHGRSRSPALHLEFGKESDEPLERPDAGQTLLCHRLAESRDSSEVYASLL